MLTAAEVALPFSLKEVELDVDDIIFFQRILPHTEHAVGIINKGIVRQNLLVLIDGIDVEYKGAVGIHEQRHTVKHLLQLFFVGDVVEAV